ncbi:MAG TPA: two-component regulator propeller domain-containing protein [Hanamia sp.]
MKFILSILFLLVSQNDYCQTGKQLHFNFTHIDHYDGLADNYVSYIGQDKKGFMWFNTANGLQRYDGTWFRTYRGDFFADSESILEISGISIRDNEIYADYKDQVYQYHPFQNKFLAYSPDLSAVKSQSEIFTDENNNQWYLNKYGIYCFDKKSGKLIPASIFLPASPGQSSNPAYDSANQQYWIYFKNNCFILDIKTKKVYSTTDSIKNIFPKIIRDKRKDGYIHDLLIDSDHNLWMSTWAGSLVKYNLVTKKVNDYSLHKIKSGQKNYIKSSGPMLVHKFLEDNHKNVWLATYGNGLLRYNKRTEKFDYEIEDRNNINEIKYNYEISSIFQDKQGDIWVGADAGISVFNPYNTLFKTISVGANQPRLLPPNEIDALYQTKNKKIIVGTWGGGTTFFDSAFNFEKNYYFNNDFRNLAWCFVEDNQGKIWSGCQFGVINRFRPDGRFLDSIRPAEAEGSTIRCMVKDKRGNIFFGLHNGKIIRWDATKNKFYKYNFGKPVFSRQPSVTNLFIDNH